MYGKLLKEHHTPTTDVLVKVRNKKIRDQKRSEAYDALQAAMPPRFGRFRGDAATLRAAIEAAREAGVSLVALRDAEGALARLEEKEA